MHTPPQNSKPSSSLRDRFQAFARVTAQAMGSHWAFIVSLVIVAVWAATGSLFHYSDTWQLVINTGTTIITFLMVFLIQSTQNRDAKAIHLKLDELIRAIKGARNDLVLLEDMTEEELDDLAVQFARLKTRASVAAERKKAHSSETDPAR